MTSVDSGLRALLEQVAHLTAALAEEKEQSAKERAGRESCQAVIAIIPGITYRCLNDPDYTTVFIGGRLPTLGNWRLHSLLSEARKNIAQLIHSDDLARVNASIAQQLETNGAYDVEYRLVLADGRQCWVNDYGRRVRSESDQSEYLDGVLLDINQRKQTEQALCASEARFRILVDHSPDLISLVDPDGRLSYVSPSWHLHLGYPSSFWRGKSWRPLVHPDDLPECERYVSVVQAAGHATSQLEYRVQHINGQWRWHEAAMEAIRDAKGQLLSFVAISRDIQERKQKEARMLEMAYHDALTGLANRPLFMDRLRQALAQGKRQAHRVAVAFLDLDRFKLVNDELGHDMGDQMLQAAARRLEQLVRDSDTVARFGGDEFVLILSDLKAVADISTLADKIVSKFAQPFQMGDQKIEITTSMGIAMYPDDAAESGALVELADKAMYHAKRTGRNRYALAGALADDAFPGEQEI